MRVGNIILFIMWGALMIHGVYGMYTRKGLKYTLAVFGAAAILGLLIGVAIVVVGAIFD